MFRFLQLQFREVELHVLLLGSLGQLYDCAISSFFAVGRYDYVVCNHVHIINVTKCLVHSLRSTSDTEQSPKGIRLKKYLPNDVLKVVREAFSSERGTCQNASFRSITVNTFLPLRRHVTSSMVGIWKFYRFKALFNSLGSRQSLKDPSFFSTITRLCTQSVGLLAFCVTFCFSNRSSLSFILSCSPNGTLRGGSFTGIESCSTTV